jgi:hypothetical protein
MTTLTNTHSRFQWRKPDRNDQIAIVPRAKLKEEWNRTPDWAGRVFTWDEAIDRREVRFLYLADLYDERNDLPAGLAGIEQIESVSMPTRLVKLIEPDSPLCRVASLELLGDSNASCPKALKLVQAKRLVCGDGVFKFKKANFPALEHLHLRLDPKGELLEVAGEYRLSVLGAGPCSTANWSFAKASAVEPAFVRLYGGNLASLDGVDALSRMTDLWLHTMPNLVELAPLRACVKLEEITLAHCPKIADLEVLLDLPNLRRLMLFSCENPKVPALRSAFEKRLEWFSAS